MLIHWFNSPMNCEPPNYEITDITRGSLGTSRGILAAPAESFWTAATPFNNFSPLHLLIPAECPCGHQGRVSQAVHFREPVKTHWVSLLNTPLPSWRERETDRHTSSSGPSIVRETKVVAVPLWEGLVMISNSHKNIPLFW